MDRYKLQQHRIINLNNTGMQTVLKCSKVIAETGKDQIGKIEFADRGKLMTCGIITAAGCSIPPVMIFPRVSYKDHFISAAPPGSILTAEIFPLGPVLSILKIMIN